MAPKFLIDENVPFEVAKALHQAGYDIATITDVTQAGIRNDELAELSVQI